MEIEKLIERLQNWDGIKPDREIDCAIEGLKALQAENDRLRRERDAVVKDIWVPRWESCKFGPGCDYISAVTGFPDFAGCGEWTWRGLKEE